MRDSTCCARVCACVREKAVHDVLSVQKIQFDERSVAEISVVQAFGCGAPPTTLRPFVGPGSMDWDTGVVTRSMRTPGSSDAGVLGCIFSHQGLRILTPGSSDEGTRVVIVSWLGLMFSHQGRRIGPHARKPAKLKFLERCAHTLNFAHAIVRRGCGLKVRKLCAHAVSYPNGGRVWTSKFVP